MRKVSKVCAIFLLCVLVFGVSFVHPRSPGIKGWITDIRTDVLPGTACGPSSTLIYHVYVQNSRGTTTMLTYDKWEWAAQNKRYTVSIGDNVETYTIKQGNGCDTYNGMVLLRLWEGPYDHK